MTSKTHKLDDSVIPDSPDRQWLSRALLDLVRSLGFEDKFRAKSWYEVNDIPNPAFLKFLEDAMNEGEAYEKLPRFIPYAVLPVSMALLLFRFIQVAVKIWTGKIDRIVASHEVEDEIAEVRERKGDL